jgi:hypothetical protein
MLFCAFLAACGTTDERPATFEVIVYEVMAPTCGAVQCHSTSTRIQGLAFDTLDAARDSLRNTGDIIEVIDEQSMPPDSPMFENDIVLLKKWIADGKPGL